MKKLVLVRYGEYDSAGHINDVGRMNMQSAAGYIVDHTKTNSMIVVAANIPRAIESARVLAATLSLMEPVVVDELYAAAEDQRLPDCSVAYDKLVQLAGSLEVVVAVVSREYIESLPPYIAGHVFGEVEFASASLERGEALMVDLEARRVYPLRARI